MIERWTIKIKEGLTGEGLEVRAWTDKDGEFVLYEDFLKLKKEFDDYKYLVDNTPFGHWKQRAEQAEEQVEEEKIKKDVFDKMAVEWGNSIRKLSIIKEWFEKHSKGENGGYEVHNGYVYLQGLGCFDENNLTRKERET